jgi:hypothetical protein
MAKTKWWAMWDIESAGSGYKGVTVGAVKKGATLPTEDISESGGIGREGPVFTCKLAQVEAESGEEAIIIAGEAYGTRGGVGAFPEAKKELTFKAA